MNSTLQACCLFIQKYILLISLDQALASLSYLQPHIDAIHAKAEALDVPTPVIDAFQELLHSTQ
jgi:ubiquitin carboxyl-terminal hydrolase 1